MEVKKRKIPERRCVGCGETKEKKQLIRVVRTPEGDVVLDVTGKKSGRGAYICKTKDCLDLCQKRKCFERAFNTDINPQIYEELRGELGQTED